MSTSGRPPPFLAAREQNHHQHQHQHQQQPHQYQATTNGDESGSSTSRAEQRPSGRPKRTLIESACSACRRRKSRCDGLRPSCSRCQSLRTDCAYEAEEGESRWSALRRRNQILDTERAELLELLSYLQTRPENEAMQLFHRIRSAPRHHDDLLALLRQYPPPPDQPQVLQGGGGGGGQRLPPISAMVPTLPLTPSLSSTQSYPSTSSGGYEPGSPPEMGQQGQARPY